MSNSNSLAPLNTNITNSTNSSTNSTNSTNSTLLRNTTNRVLFCKSKALFFKKVYNAIFNDKRTGKSGEVGRVQTTGRNLAEFMDKDCFVDSQIDENQLYNVEFTVAIMELIPVKEPKNLTHHHFTVN
jgi:hypothetical protein